MRTSLPAAVLAASLISATALLSTTGLAAADASSPKHYASCKEMHKKYPHGVGRKGATDHTSGKKVTNFYVSDSLYKANTKRDADKDGIACEHA